MDQQSIRDQYQLKGWAGLFSLLGALTVILGAFGAHGLEGKISAESLSTYNTGILYQFIHILIALIVVLTAREKSDRLILIGCWSFLLGIIFFSGSLYLLSTAELTTIDFSFLGPVTPIGGLFFIVGWISIAIYFFKTR